MEIAKHTLISGGLILAIGTLSALFAQKIKVPDVPVFLLVGIVIGPQALGLVNISANSALNQIILLFGASYILFDGGASLRFRGVETGVDHDRDPRHSRGRDHRGHHQHHGPLRSRGAGRDRHATGRDACLDRPRDARAHFPAIANPAARGANRDERIGLQ